MKKQATAMAVVHHAQAHLPSGFTRPAMPMLGLCSALCLALVLGACSSTPPQTGTASRETHNTPLPPTPVGRDRGVYHPQRNDLALYAMSLLDTRYSWGGRGPATGFDCSGLVSHVYKEAAGLPVKGSSADLGQKSRPVERAQLLPGDLVFFNTLGARHSHVGIYVGGGRFVHASNPRTGVRMDQLSNRYYAQRFEGAGTLLD
jgi:cell wall-associated NlpC family hydrolase